MPTGDNGSTEPSFAYKREVAYSFGPAYDSGEEDKWNTTGPASGGSSPDSTLPSYGPMPPEIKVDTNAGKDTEEVQYPPAGGKESDEGSSDSAPKDDASIASGQNKGTSPFEESPKKHYDHHKCHNSDPCMELIDGEKCEYRPRDCSDEDPNTNDYCYGGQCYHINQNCNTPGDCDDRNACTDDTCVNGKCMRAPKNCDDHNPNPCTYDECDRLRGCHSHNKCDDGDPCTVDRCDRWGHCTRTQVVCGYGKVCVDGTCQYPYWSYYPYYDYYPYYPYAAPYVPPATAAKQPQSYTIPAGASVALPWGQSVVAAEALQVYNGLAYPGAAPLKFNRSIRVPSPMISVGKTASPSYMIGLSWKDTGFGMTLIQPNEVALPIQGDGRNVVHLTGSNYDYYFLRSPMAGYWTVQITPVNPPAGGAGYTLTSGMVRGAIPNQP